jgi:SAM-dependent methyltransferase
MTRSPTIADYLAWDARSWAFALAFWSGQAKRAFAGTRVLELGAGRGGLSLWFALRGASVVCSDIKPPSDVAIALHRDHGVEDSVDYEVLDATRIPYKEVFDVVAFRSMLGAVGRSGRKDLQALAIREAHHALRPGGQLFFAENLSASPLHRLARRRFVRWGSNWRYVSVAELLEFLELFERVDYRTSGVLGAFGRNGGQRALLASVDRRVLNHVVPPSWRYIIAGVARKAG